MVQTPRHECTVCHRPLCQRELVVNRAAGFNRSAMCPACLAGHLGVDPDRMLRALTAYIKTRPCLFGTWAYRCPCGEQGSRSFCPAAPGPRPKARRTL